MFHTDARQPPDRDQNKGSGVLHQIESPSSFLILGGPQARTTLATTPLLSIRTTIARLESNIQALAEKIGRFEQKTERTEDERQDLVEWRKQRTQYKTNLKDAREKERQELLRIGGVLVYDVL